MKSLKELFRLLIMNDTGYSSVTFILLLSSFIGSFFVFALSISLVIDVSYDGRIDTNLEHVGWVLAGASTIILGGSVGKIFKDKFEKDEQLSDDNLQDKKNKREC